MPRGDFLGEFEQVLLLAVVRLGDNAYGMTIRDEIERHTRQDVSIGSVYSALDRMKRAGYVTAEVGTPTRERGGRAKRYFRLEDVGAEALTRSRSTLDSLWDGLELEAERLS